MDRDDKIAETINERLPRFLAAGVDHNDVQRILRRIHGWEDWCEAWVTQGAEHEALAEAALEAGNIVTAGEAFVRAALYFHFGQLLAFADREQKRQVQERKVRACTRALPHLQPPGVRVEIPFEDLRFPAHLRLPEGARKVPCILLTAGADSTKEEFVSLENEFLKRGLATLSYDGPGQGETWYRMKLRDDFEKAVSAIIDYLQKERPEVDARRIAIWGRSLGGYLAPRAAASDPRIAACMSIGGFYDLPSIWDRFPPSVRETFQYAWAVPTLEDARRRADAVRLDGLLRNLRCPFLIVHSGQDIVCPLEHAERMNKEAGGPTNLVVFPEGNHVCDNIPYKYRPLMADWAARHLA
jgi:dipeptidyl aminopeptidase/acylaminoacyl peptidase